MHFDDTYAISRGIPYDDSSEIFGISTAAIETTIIFQQLPFGCAVMFENSKYRKTKCQINSNEQECGLFGATWPKYRLQFLSLLFHFLGVFRVFTDIRTPISYIVRLSIVHAAPHSCFTCIVINRNDLLKLMS